MAVSTTTTSVSYTGNGSTTSFAVTFPFQGTGANAELQVVERVIATGAETVKTYTTHYTVTGGSGSTGTVVAASAPASTVQWHIRRTTTRTQTVDYTPNDPFPADTHELALDRLAMGNQEIQEELNRSFKVALTDSAIGTVPNSVDRANNILAFDSDGNPKVITTTSLATVAASINRTVDTFSGNASTTAFTLSVDPGREENCQVFIDGVHQAHSTYSVSGTTLTFSTAPPSGTNNIECVHGAALAEAGPTGATGATGAAGAQGVQGPRGQGGVEYNFESTTTDADQGVGKVFLNNSTVSSATVLFLDDVDANSVNLNSYIDTWDDSTTTGLRGTVHLVEIANPTNYAIFNVTNSTISASTYSKVAVTHVASGGSFTDGNAMSVLFTRTGNAGSGLANIVEDSSPQLGGDLDLNSNNIDFPSVANISDCLDEDNMASNSATKLATQQSIKAYADLKAVKGANSDITSLSGLTTALSVAQGGTGATSLTDGGVLLGSGTGAITAMTALGDGAIVVGDGTTDPVALTAFSSSTGNLLSAKGGTIGKQTIWVPAAAMRPESSNGCSAMTDVVTTSGRPDISGLLFDGASDEFAMFNIGFPKGWDEGVIQYRYFFAVTDAAATDGTDTVSFALQGVSVADDATIDVAFGTGVNLTQAISGTVEDVGISAVSGNVTIASAAADTLTFFRIGRDVSADDMTEDCVLLGCQIFYTIDAGEDS